MLGASGNEVKSSEENWVIGFVSKRPLAVVGTRLSSEGVISELSGRDRLPSSSSTWTCPLEPRVIPTPPSRLTGC